MFYVISILVVEVEVLCILSGEVIQKLGNRRSNSVYLKVGVPGGL